MKTLRQVSHTNISHIQSIYKIALARSDSTNTTTNVILCQSGYSVITPGSGTFSPSVNFPIQEHSHPQSISRLIFFSCCCSFSFEIPKHPKYISLIPLCRQKLYAKRCSLPIQGRTCWKQALVRSPSRANELCRTSGIGSWK